MSIALDIAPDDRAIFGDQSKTTTFLDFVKDESAKKCLDDIKAGRVRLDKIPNTYLVEIHGGSGYLNAFLGQENSGQRRFLTDWVVQSNTLASSFAEDQAQRRTDEERRQAQSRAQQQAQEEDQRVALEKTKPISVIAGPLSTNVAQCVRDFFPNMGFSAPLFKPSPCSDYIRVDGVKTIDTRDIQGETEVLTEITVVALRPIAAHSLIAESCYGGTQNDLATNDRVRVQTRIRFEKWNSSLRCTSNNW